MCLFVYYFTSMFCRFFSCNHRCHSWRWRTNYYTCIFNGGSSTPYGLSTNKLCATCSSLTSCFNFAQSGKINLKLFKILAPFSLMGAILGVNAVMGIDANCLNIIVLVLLVIVALFSLFSKNVGLKNNFHGLNKKKYPTRNISIFFCRLLYRFFLVLVQELL